MIDYYEVLGIPEDASQEVIKNAYRRRAKEINLNYLQGLRNKYQEDGEERLLDILDEKLAQAEEVMKLLNGAYEVLKDPAQRAEYDDKLAEAEEAEEDEEEEVEEEPVYPDCEPAEIVITPSELDFGELKEGETGTLTFVVDNKGGFAIPRSVDWETKPDWAKDLIIRHDPDDPFPIEVAVVVDTTGVSPGLKNQRILVVVENLVFKVGVSLRVKEPEPAVAKHKAKKNSTKVSGTSSRTTAKSSGKPPTKAKKSPVLAIVLIYGILGCVVVGLLVAFLGPLLVEWEPEPSEGTLSWSQVVETRQAEAIRNTKVAREFQQEVDLLLSSPQSVVEFRRIGEATEEVRATAYCQSGEYERSLCEKRRFGKYKLVNNAEHFRLWVLYGTGGNCVPLDSPDSVIQSFYLDSGEEKILACIEYELGSGGNTWESKTSCFSVGAEDSRRGTVDFCTSSQH